MHGCSVPPRVLLEHMKHVLDVLADLQGHMQRMYSAALTASGERRSLKPFSPQERFLNTSMEHLLNVLANLQNAMRFHAASQQCMDVSVLDSYNKLMFI